MIWTAFLLSFMMFLFAFFVFLSCFISRLFIFTAFLIYCHTIVAYRLTHAHDTRHYRSSRGGPDGGIDFWKNIVLPRNNKGNCIMWQLYCFISFVFLSKTMFFQKSIPPPRPPLKERSCRFSVVATAMITVHSWAETFKKPMKFIKTLWSFYS